MIIETPMISNSKKNLGN